jgi:SAM-dependent methyltransferase
MPEWFEEWFGEDYLALYPHRNDADAAELVGLLTRVLPWRPGLRILDVGCGPGRHARALELAGAQCVGVDLSAVLLARARQVTGAPLVRADMRALPVRDQSMDVTVNLFTSFGYFEDDRAHREALAGMVATVRPGGWFVIDFLNADAVRGQLGAAPPAGLAPGPRRLSDDGRFVLKSITTAAGRQFAERVRLFSAAELEAMLEAAGLAVRHRFGSYAGAPLSADAPRTILLGQPA